jgi:hypothetical protein
MRNPSTIRWSDEDKAIMARLRQRMGLDNDSAVVRYAIRYLDEHGPIRAKEGTVDNYTRRMNEQEDAMLTETDDNRPTYMWTSDRTAQVNWIMELAGDLHSNWQGSVSDYADAETYAETIVTAYLERMAEEREAMPDWWDAHDRGLLVRFVTQECES